MSRNSSGTYSLPAGNPVVTGTTITSTWGNTTMSDIAIALTDSLSRTGLGGMSAGLPLFDGTASLPGLSWGTELTSGLYRAGAGDYRWVNTTTELLQLTANLFRVSGTAPVFRINETDAAANNRLWDIIATGEDLFFRVLTDALAATNWLAVTRTAGTIDVINFPNGTLQYGGIEVGFRGIPIDTKSGDYTAVLADAGKGFYTETTSLTFTIPANASVAYAIGTALTFSNRSAGNLSIAITSDTLELAGTFTSGTRTLGPGGLATAVKVKSNVWQISGSGLS